MKLIYKILSATVLLSFTSFTGLAIAEDKAPVTNQEVLELKYVEREPGVDDYEVTMLVSDRYIRVDEVGETSGYIVYDDNEKTIYSVSHHDQSVLVIKEHQFSEKDSPVKASVEYLQLSDAPKVSGKSVFNYRVFTNTDKQEETCIEVQLVENMLPAVAKILKNYQTVISGQQVKMTDGNVSDVQPACFFVDQVYNKGLYYDKGLPIQEWHSNESSKILKSFDKVKVADDVFTVPKDYREFSIDKNSRTFIN